jgi:hypothetical protein
MVYIQQPLDTDDLGKLAKSAIIRPSIIVVHPPSDFQSAFQSVISFLCSAIGDFAGMLTNPKKLSGWMNSLTQFNTFLESTGLGDEMDDAIQKPLLCGRLVDNFKILNDIQELHQKDRVAMAQDDNEEACKLGLQQDIIRGHRMMRFATSAYGTEMILSAVDEGIEASEILEDNVRAISLHTNIPEEDIQFVFSRYEDDHDKHVLHHFVALDHMEKSVVLAIRGTLDLSGVIVDIQGMAADFCYGKAHKGMATMARNLWNQSGDKIIELVNKYRDYKLVITGHSLGAGTSCLLTLQLYVDEVLPDDRTIECFAFAPPPTFHPLPHDSICGAKLERAIRNTVAYIHDNDVVPFLSVTAVRRLVNLLDAVDSKTELMWFWQRWKIFYDYSPIPAAITNCVLEAEQNLKRDGDSRVLYGECNLTIPSRRIVWCKRTVVDGRYEAFSCCPKKVSHENIFLTPDMLSDHMPEQYENALDAILETIGV